MPRTLPRDASPPSSLPQAPALPRPARCRAGTGPAEPVPDQVRTTGARLVPWAYVEGSGARPYRLVRPERRPDERTVTSGGGRGPEPVTDVPVGVAHGSYSGRKWMTACS